MHTCNNFIGIWDSEATQNLTNIPSASPISVGKYDFD